MRCGSQNEHEHQCDSLGRGAAASLSTGASRRASEQKGERVLARVEPTPKRKYVPKKKSTLPKQEHANEAGAY
jgi:hypothetical protein